MTVDLNKLGSISGKKYGEPLDDPVCVCSFEKVLLAEELIDFGDPVRPMMDCIEQLSKRQLVHSRMISLFYVTKFLTAIVTGQENPAGLSFHVFLMEY